MRIWNGRKGNDQNICKCAEVGNRGSSVVDCVISTQHLLQNVEHFSVNDPNILSDHCLIDFTLIFCKSVLINEHDVQSRDFVNYKESLEIE